MNYIKQLEMDKKALQEQLATVNQEITDIMTYLSSSKFSGVDADYVQVSTDILPKLSVLRLLTL